MLVVLLEPKEVPRQIELLRFRIAEARSDPLNRATSSPCDFSHYANAIEWIEYEP